MRKTLTLILAFFVGTIVASLFSCATEERCPNTPKMVATFSVGDHVAFKRGIAVLYSARSTPERFDVNKGDTGIVVDINYFENSIQYQVRLDKAKCNEELLIAPAWEDASYSYLEAVIYPDPALAPRK